MRKGLVLAALLLVLTLLPTAPMAVGGKGGKPGPNPEEETHLVCFVDGDLETETDEPVNLTVMKSGWLTVYYGYANITFQDRVTSHDDPDSVLSWNDFKWLSQSWEQRWGEYFFEQFPERNNFGKVWVRVDTKAGETWFYYDFDRYLEDELDEEHQRYVGWFKYELSGQLQSFSPEDGASISGQPFTIVQKFFEPSGKGRSATGVRTEWRWSGSLTFTIESAES